MQFDRDEFALLSRGGRVPRMGMSRSGPSPLPVRRRRRRWPGAVGFGRRRVESARPVGSGARVTRAVYGESRER
jgi:hypothetical protein